MSGARFAGKRRVCSFHELAEESGICSNEALLSGTFGGIRADLSDRADLIEDQLLHFRRIGMELAGEARLARIRHKSGKSRAAKVKQADMIAAFEVDLGLLYQTLIDDDP